MVKWPLALILFLGHSLFDFRKHAIEITAGEPFETDKSEQAIKVVSTASPSIWALVRNSNGKALDKTRVDVFRLYST
ncbi:hypothetical protein F5Y05DRAFT_396262 [Hypoxylon sp. FL0543]|nr:hypothetical protein F5Y05DRAFT_396262 [Hypoxylon sp. FL0543]